MIPGKRKVLMVALAVIVIVTAVLLIVFRGRIAGASDGGGSDVRTACGSDHISVTYRVSADGSLIDGGGNGEGRC